MGKRKRRRKRITRREITLQVSGYQPSKAELEEDVRLPATPIQLAKGRDAGRDRDADGLKGGVTFVCNSP